MVFMNKEDVYKIIDLLPKYSHKSVKEKLLRIIPITEIINALFSSRAFKKFFLILTIANLKLLIPTLHSP